MSQKVKVELDIAGLRAFRRSQDVKDMLYSYAKDIPPSRGYAVKMITNEGRSVAIVHPVTNEAYQDTMDGILLRRIGQ